MWHMGKNGSVSERMGVSESNHKTSTRVASDARSVAASERTDAVSAVGALERFEALSRAGSPLQLRR